MGRTRRGDRPRRCYDGAESVSGGRAHSSEHAPEARPTPERAKPADREGSAPLAGGQQRDASGDEEGQEPTDDRAHQEGVPDAFDSKHPAFGNMI
jgi:hypothetical protein